jgi:hypothetical protein
MGNILSKIAKKIKGDCCEHLVQFVGQQVTVTGISAGLANFKVDIGGFSNKIKEINEVPETMKALDNNQYLLCRQISELPADAPLKETCIRIRLMIILAFNQLQALLGVQKPDKQLRAEIVAWIEQMNKLTRQCIKILQPKISIDFNERVEMIEKRGSEKYERVPVFKEHIRPPLEIGGRTTVANIMAYQGIDEEEMNEAVGIIKRKLERKS